MLIFTIFIQEKFINVWRINKYVVILHPHFVAPCPKTRFNYNFLKQKQMIIVQVKEGENIEKALKKFKRKFEKTGVVKELRSRQQFDKPSVLKRLKMERAVYVQKLRNVEE